MRINIPFRGDRQPLKDITEEVRKEELRDDIDLNGLRGTAEQIRPGLSVEVQNSFRSEGLPPLPLAPSDENDIPVYGNNINNFA